MESGENVTNTTYVFSRKNLKRYAIEEISEMFIYPFFLLLLSDGAFLQNRDSSYRPIAHLPCPGKATLAVRCCPVYFELRPVVEAGTLEPQGCVTFSEAGHQGGWGEVSMWVGSVWSVLRAKTDVIKIRVRFCVV